MGKKCLYSIIKKTVVNIDNLSELNLARKVFKKKTIKAKSTSVFIKNMPKIFTLIKIILRSTFIFKTPEKHDLILWDDVSFNDLKNVISGFDFFILQTRPYKVTKVYISFKIFRNIFKNFSKGNLFTAYLVS